jgi:hypothetical protein
MLARDEDQASAGAQSAPVSLPHRRTGAATLSLFYPCNRAAAACRARAALPAWRQQSTYAFGALRETARTRERGRTPALGNRRPLAAHAETLAWPTSARCAGHDHALAADESSLESGLQRSLEPARDVVCVDRNHRSTGRDVCRKGLGTGSPGFRPRTPRSWPKPTGNDGNPRVSRPTAPVRTACKPGRSARPFPVTENRGVPGSSPGLAIGRSACK